MIDDEPLNPCDVKPTVGLADAVFPAIALRRLTVLKLPTPPNAIMSLIIFAFNGSCIAYCEYPPTLEAVIIIWSSLKSVSFNTTLIPFDSVQTVASNSSLVSTFAISPCAGGVTIRGSSETSSTYASISSAFVCSTIAKTSSSVGYTKPSFSGPEIAITIFLS